MMTMTMAVLRVFGFYALPLVQLPLLAPPLGAVAADAAAPARGAALAMVQRRAIATAQGQGADEVTTSPPSEAKGADEVTTSPPSEVEGADEDTTSPPSDVEGADEDEGAGENSTSNVYKTLRDVETLDSDVQQKESEQSAHITSMISDAQAKLKAERDKLARIFKKNTELKEQLHAKLNHNQLLRSELKDTKISAKKIADEFRSVGKDLAAAGNSLESVLAEDVEMPRPSELAAIQLGRSLDPSDEMTGLEASLQDAYSKVESEVWSQTNSTLEDLRVREVELENHQKQLLDSLRFARAQEERLSAAVRRLQKMIADISPQLAALKSSAASAIDVAFKAEEDLPRSANASASANVAALNVDASREHESLNHRAGPPAFVEGALSAANAVLSSAHAMIR